MEGNIYYISDLHFQHTNIIKFDNRPFSSVGEMDNILISNWNNKVSNKDRVFILGDFCWGKETDWLYYLPKLNGIKTLIKGNHDLRQMSTTCRKFFVDIKDYKEIKDKGRTIIMSHYPILCYKHSYHDDTYMLFGHVHNRTQESLMVQEWIEGIKRNCTESFHNKGKLYNVGCMMPWMNYTPQTLDEIIENYSNYFLGGNN